MHFEVEEDVSRTFESFARFYRYGLFKDAFVSFQEDFSGQVRESPPLVAEHCHMLLCQGHFDEVVDFLHSRITKLQGESYLLLSLTESYAQLHKILNNIELDTPRAREAQVNATTSLTLSAMRDGKAFDWYKTKGERQEIQVWPFPNQLQLLVT